MYAATVDRCLKLRSRAARIKGISDNQTLNYCCVPITIHTHLAGAQGPGGDRGRHCGCALRPESNRRARPQSRTMTDLVTGWTERPPIRNNAPRILDIKECRAAVLFPMTARLR